MRIIGGKFKRRKLKFPKSPHIRPATDRLKETIFNVLGQNLDGMRVLDLYAGMGSLGIEALSRGAVAATFIEKNSLAIRYIRDNLTDLGLQGEGEVLQKDVGEALEGLISTGAQYDVIFVDPPYNKGLIKKTLLQIDRSDILSPHGQVVSEHVRHEPIPPTRVLHLLKSNQYGVTSLSFLCRLDLE